jgi:hypothetical protein
LGYLDNPGPVPLSQLTDGQFRPSTDVIMRMFSKSLIKDAATWFKGLRADSIGSWIEFSNAFLKYWGEYKSLDSYLADFYALK